MLNYQRVIIKPLSSWFYNPISIILNPSGSLGAYEREWKKVGIDSSVNAPNINADSSHLHSCISDMSVRDKLSTSYLWTFEERTLILYCDTDASYSQKQDSISLPSSFVSKRCRSRRKHTWHSGSGHGQAQPVASNGLSTDALLREQQPQMVSCPLDNEIDISHYADLIPLLRYV